MLSAASSACAAHLPATALNPKDLADKVLRDLVDEKGWFEVKTFPISELNIVALWGVKAENDKECYLIRPLPSTSEWTFASLTKDQHYLTKYESFLVPDRNKQKSAVIVVALVGSGTPDGSNEIVYYYCKQFNPN